MRGIAAGLVLAAVAGHSSAQQASKPSSPSQIVYSSEDMRYRVRFPDSPETKTKNLPTAAGVVQTRTERIETGRDLVLSVTVATFTEKFKELDPKTVLNGVRDGLKGKDGDLKTDEDVKLEAGDTSITGREFRVEAGKNAIRCRAFLVGNRLYQVMATGPKDAVRGTSAETFLKSFEVLE